MDITELTNRLYALKAEEARIKEERMQAEAALAYALAMPQK